MHDDLWMRALLTFVLGLAVGVLMGTLRRFGPVGRLRFSAVLATWMGGAMLVLPASGIAEETAILRVVVAVGVLAAADSLLQVLDLVVWNYLLDRRRIFVPRLLVDVFNLLALVAVALLLLKFDFGVSLTGLLVTSTVVSAIIGLALQDILGNLIAGLALQVERPFTVGDWVMVGGREGYVTQLNWRTLSIRTRDGDEISIPNAVVAKSEISNQSRPTPLQRAHVTVGIGYEHPPGVVKAALERAAAAAAGVVPEPPVEALVRSFGDFAIQYEVRFWLLDYARLHQICDDVLSRIWYELRRCDLDIPVPLRRVTMRTVTGDEDGEQHRQRQQAVFEVLRPLELFASLDDAQIGELAAHASLHRFGPGEMLVREGEEGCSLFVIRDGRARIEKRLETGAPAELGTLDAGSFFGEMSLVTGEPRSASVVAETDTEVVIVDKAALAPILFADAALCESLSEVVERHARNAAERMSELGAADAPAKAETPKEVLLRTIRRFFGLAEE